MGALEKINAKLRSHNLEVEADLASRMSAPEMTSKGVQCDMTNAEVIGISSRGSSGESSQSCSTDGVLEAVRQCNLAHLRAILKTYPSEEVNVTTEDEGMSALHLAAKAGHVEAARLLLGSEKFSAVNSHTSAKQHTYAIALHEAAFAGHEGVVALLLTSPRFVAESARASKGYTALHSAADQGSVKS